MVLCVDEALGHGQYRGRIYHRYADGAIPVGASLAMLRVMEDLFDEIRFPSPAVRERSFVETDGLRSYHQEKKERIMSDKDLLTKHGDLGTFIIKVQQRQAGTWQGRVTWVEKNKTVRFRSVLELLKLMDEGILAEYPELADEDVPSWEE